ncbi:16S rRNA (guanine(527)-N(7))-methyltransferase RsmG [Gallionella capsiferriformans]|uniref:Ribosomal RNA small subunit methyltransferase G n=1 Tax=Gallionella capsiferriformans (strain ES-2) TaxID=395494 RepID=D9SEP0_GALCS|nr:16S rRNA (guanine(527)-N(7))-methyltransferase RsmG [Gallionella capsiferriformans]ADL56935.1 methyltransferase GidB [Gallionella capsiferriformans ES-2]
MPNNNQTALHAGLHRGIAELGLSVDSDTEQKLIDYLQLLVKWNKVYNLTAIRDPQQMVSYHLLDSLAVLPHLQAGRWLDVGCGAGLPGLVLAICRPDWSVTLLDSNSKKTGFVQQAIIELGLHNAQVRCARVEDVDASQKYSGIISRAFTELGDFLRVTRHLMADDGHWVAMKGLPDKELPGVPKDCTVLKIIPLKVPGLDAARCLVIAKPGEPHD